MLSRSVHEIVWGLVFVAAAGLGTLAGILALAVRSVGFVSKTVAEAIEDVDPGPIDAMRAVGAGRLQILVFRAATVIGFFGAGGMGSCLRESVQRIESQQVAAIMFSIVAVVLVAEVLSTWARVRVARAVA